MGVKWDDVSITDVTSLAGTEYWVCVQESTTKRVTADQAAAHAVDTLLAADAATPTAGDKVVAERAGTEKLYTLADLASYCVASGWSGASAADPVVTGDMVLVDRGGTVYKVDVDTLVTYALTGVQASTLDISGLTAATLAGTDQYLVVQGSTAKKTTLADLETKLWTDYATYVSGLTAVETAADGDVFYTIQGATPKYMTGSVLATYMTAEIKGAVVDSAWDDAAAVTDVQAADVFLLERADVRKTVAASYLATYALSGLSGSAAVDPVASGDDFLLYRGGAAKLADTSVMAAYFLPLVFNWTTETSMVDADELVFGRSGTGKTITYANFKSGVLSGLQASTLDISGLSAATLTATDEFLVCQTGTAKKTTLADLETKLWTDYATYVAGLTEITTVADAHKFYAIDAGTPKYTTADAIAEYVIKEAYADASTVSPAVTGDLLLVNRSGTIYDMNVDTLVTYALSGAQSTILNISGLDAATIAASDHVLVCQGSTPKRATVEDLTAEVHGEFADYVAARDAVTALTAEDDFCLVQGGALMRVDLGDLADYVVAQAGELPWTLVGSSKYTATPPTTSTLTMSDTSDMAIGKPIRFTQSATNYYAIVTALSANASITIAGAPLDTGAQVTELRVGPPETVEQVEFKVSGAWAASVQDVLAAVAKTYFKWQRQDAYLVAISAVHATADTGAAQPKLNVKVAGDLVSTEDSNAGLQLSTAGTWVDGSAVAISASNYKISRGDAVEIRCTSTGSNADAEDLTVSLVFVFE